MSRWNVIVAALDGRTAAAEELCRRLARAWSSPSVAAFTLAPASDLQSQSLRAADVLVIVARGDESQSEIMPLLSAMEEAGVPVLALVDGDPTSYNSFAYGGAIVETPHASESRLCALLEGALHSTRRIQQLRAEVELHERFHGGLKGQIARMHEELQLAAIMQREFLPREMPAIHGVDFAALWRPSNYVSGDIYDLIRLDEDHIGVFVADAVGHGVPAALMTMVICRSLITKEVSGASYRLVPPSEVLYRLNLEIIRHQAQTTRFVTAVYAVVNCRERVVQLAGAGHPHPLWLRPDGSSRALDTTGGLLGIFPEETYQQIEIELEADDRLLFFTDGFEQAFPAAQTDFYSRRIPNNRYRSEFDQLRRSPTPHELVEALNRRLDDQSGSLHQIDDLTLVCVHAGPVLVHDAYGASTNAGLAAPSTFAAGS